jgi:hypothetical protein
MTGKDLPPRARIDEEDLDAAVDGLLSELVRHERSLELLALKDRIEAMSLAELVKHVHDMLLSTSAEMSRELQALRWEAFGSIIDDLTGRSQGPPRNREDGIEHLREFAYNYELNEVLNRPAPERSGFRDELRRRYR